MKNLLALSENKPIVINPDSKKFRQKKKEEKRMMNKKYNSQTAYEDKQRDDNKLSVFASCLFDDFINSSDFMNN